MLQAVKASLKGRAVNTGRLGIRFGRLDAELRRQLVNLQVNGGRLGLQPPFDGSEDMPMAELPPRASAKDNAGLLRELYDQMKRGEVLVIFHQKLGEQKLAINPGFLIDKTNDVGMPKIKPDGEVAKRAILNLSAAVCGLDSSTPAHLRCVNQAINKQQARLEEVTLPTYRSFAKLWLRETTAFPGLQIMLSSYDLSRFYPSLDIYAQDCLALGQSFWCSAEGVREALPTGSDSLEADGEIEGQAVIDIVAINVSGVMGATSMPNLAHAITMAIVILHTTEAPELSMFNGTHPFNSIGYVDDVAVIEVNAGTRPAESAQSLKEILHGSMGPTAIADKVSNFDDKLNYTGRSYLEIRRDVRGKRMFLPLTKLVKVSLMLEADEFQNDYRGEVELKALSSLTGLLTYLSSTDLTLAMALEFLYALTSRDFPEQRLAKAKGDTPEEQEAVWELFRTGLTMFRWYTSATGRNAQPVINLVPLHATIHLPCVQDRIIVFGGDAAAEPYVVHGEE